MSLSVFQTAQIKLASPTPSTLSSSSSSKSLLPPTTTLFRPKVLLPPVTGKLRKCCLTFKASSSAAVVDGGNATASLGRCYLTSPDHAPTGDFGGPVMREGGGGQYGALGAVTLKKGKLGLKVDKKTEDSPQIDIGGGGGDIGKGSKNGGGDGGDNGGDDDDYFDEFDEGDEDDSGVFRRRIILAELFDKKFVDAVLNEWQKTMMDLPAGFRQAYEMGLVSSAQIE